jgi:hypothetical protein
LGLTGRGERGRAGQGAARLLRSPITLIGLQRMTAHVAIIRMQIANRLIDDAKAKTFT